MGVDSAPVPADAATAGEFTAQLRRLKAWSGLSFRELERRAHVAGHVLPHSTSATMLGRRGLPREDLLVAFTKACGCTPEQVADWVTVRRRLAAATAAPEPSEEGDGGDVAEEAAGTPSGAARGARQGRRRWLIAGAGLVVLLAGAGLAASGHSTGATGEPTLLSDGCPAVMEPGAVGVCVQQLQRRLQAHGLRLPDDAWFGPFTKQRVMVFQAFAGLPTTAVADRRTQQALLGQKKISPPLWSTAQIERRLREVFAEDPDQAVSLARCLSYLDPLWINRDQKKVRWWGLFQFSDLELLDLRAEPVQALDPEWNIQTAHIIWRRTKDFRHWPCHRPSGE